MAEVPLTGKRGEGRVVLIDDADLPQVSQHRWHLGSNGYARTYVRRPGGTSSTLDLHLLLRDEHGGGYKDHVNGDRLDNRRANLRPCSAAENARNRKRHSNNKSGYKGVCLQNGKWRATIHLGRKQIHLGLYRHPLLAALAYNAAATALYGPFAQVNDLTGLDELLQQEVARAG